MHIWVFALLIFVPLAATAQDGEPAPTILEPKPSGPSGQRYEAQPQVDDAPYELDESQFRVTTTTRAPMKNFATDRSTNVVTGEELDQRQPNNITDALDEEPGIFVQSTNRGAGTVFLRGQVGAENLIYVDGVRFNQTTFRTGPIQYLNTLDPWALERIEVVRGPGSVLYGSDALGGVVQLFPHEIPDEPGTFTDAKAQYRSADSTYAAGIDAATRGERFGALVGGSFKIHNDLRVGENGGEDIIASSLDGNTLRQSDYQEFYFRGGAGYQLDERSQLRLNYMGGNVSDAPRVDRLGNGEIRFYDNRDDLVWLTYERDGEHAFDEVSLKFSAHRTAEVVTRFNCVRDDGGITPDPVGCALLEDELIDRRRLNDDETMTLGSSLAVSSRIEPWRARINWGAELYHDQVVESERVDFSAPEFEANPRDRGNFQPDSSSTLFGVYGFFEQSPVLTLDHELVVRGGLRLDSIQAFAPRVTPELGDVEYNHIGIVGSAGIAWYYDTISNVYFNWNQGFRSPNLQETTVLGDTGNFFEVPNPDLGPERSDTFELGTKLNFQDILRATGSVWASLASDKITRQDATLDGESEVDGKPVQERVNRDSAYFYGADLEVRTYSFFDVSAHGSLSYIDGAVEANSEDPTFEEGPLHGLFAGAENYENPRRLTPVFYTAGLTYRPSSMWYSTFYVKGAAAQDKIGPGDRGDLRICEASPGVLYDGIGESCPGSDAWTTLNVRGGVRYEAIRFDLAVENLGDLRYRYHGSGYLAPGFNVLATLSITN